MNCILKEEDFDKFTRFLKGLTNSEKVELVREIFNTNDRELWENAMMIPMVTLGIGAIDKSQSKDICEVQFPYGDKTYKVSFGVNIEEVEQ